MAHYDKVILTPGPSFYKNNLFNVLAKKQKIIVFYTGAHTHERNEDFYKGELTYENHYLPHGKVALFRYLQKFLRKNSYEELIVSGWDTVASFIVALLSKRKKNACIVESTDYESQAGGLKGLIKKVLISRMSVTYVPGKPHERLVRSLGFKGNVVQTGSCGLLNYTPQPLFEARESVKHFLFVGRLTPVKNLDFLISIFNELPQYELTIIGFGPQDEMLKSIAGPNIKFLGAINNKELPKHYRSADVFMLCSYSETWGLVVEEALNNGTPVIVSDRVGCNEDLVSEKTGLTFQSNNKESLLGAIRKITDVNYYNKLRQGVSLMNFEERAQQQVSAFLNN